MLKVKDSLNFNRGNVNYEGILKAKISLFIVMLTVKDSSNFNRGRSQRL